MVEVKQTGTPQRYPHLFRGLACALLGGIFWGFSANCAEVLMGTCGIPMPWLTCVRLVGASGLFLIIALVIAGKQVCALLVDIPSMVRMVGFALPGILLTQISYFSAIHLAGSGPALLLEQLGIAIIMLYLCLRDKRFPYRRELIGLALAIGGIICIATQGDVRTLDIPVEGLVWGLISAASLAVYNIVPVKPLAKYGSIPVMAIGMVLSALAAVIWFQPWTIDVNVPLEAWFILAAIIIIGTIAAYLLFLQGIHDAGPMRTGMLGAVEPVSAMIIGMLWQGNTVSIFDALGAVAIVAMIALVTEREHIEDGMGSSLEDVK